MRLRVFLLAAVAILAAPTAFSQDVPKIEFEKYTLPNGLRVILHVDRKLPMVHVNSWYHVGSKNERTGRTGFAHLFEHMMFEGSKNADGKYFTFIERAAANFFEGGVNGTTNEDRTTISTLCLRRIWSMFCGLNPIAWRRSPTFSPKRNWITRATS